MSARFQSLVHIVICITYFCSCVLFFIRISHTFCYIPRYNLPNPKNPERTTQFSVSKRAKDGGEREKKRERKKIVRGCASGWRHKAYLYNRTCLRRYCECATHNRAPDYVVCTFVCIRACSVFFPHALHERKRKREKHTSLTRLF